LIERSKISGPPVVSGHDPANTVWLATRNEEAIDPSRPIVDAHHHLWDFPGDRYLFDDVLADFGSGHNVVASVYLQAESMHRADGPVPMRPVGETEFINGIAAQSASGMYGKTKLCAGIVGTVDIKLGKCVQPVLEAHRRAGGDRFKGIRPVVTWHESDQVRPWEGVPHILLQPAAQEAIRCIATMGMTLDLWVFFTQLDDVVAVCETFPELVVILNHCGGPIGLGPYAADRRAMFAQWRSVIRRMAKFPKLRMKLGGLGMRYMGFDLHSQPVAPSSDALAELWAPYIETCVEAFGAERCMFESNFPVDKWVASYRVLWNAYKKMAGRYSSMQQERLFLRTAAETYRLSV
jgi:predicted TIM-barrel fold metal-dependent hydrolase